MAAQEFVEGLIGPLLTIFIVIANIVFVACAVVLARMFWGPKSPTTRAVLRGYMTTLI